MQNYLQLFSPSHLSKCSFQWPLLTCPFQNFWAVSPCCWRCQAANPAVSCSGVGQCRCCCCSLLAEVSLSSSNCSFSLGKPFQLFPWPTKGWAGTVPLLQAAQTFCVCWEVWQSFNRGSFLSLVQRGKSLFLTVELCHACVQQAAVFVFYVQC